MSSIRLSGTSSGYYDLTVPAAAGTNSIDLSNLPVKDSSGRLGIGTSSPTSKLHIVDGAGANIAIQSTAGSHWRLGDAVGSTNGYFVIYDYTNSGKRLEINNSGHVTTPSQPVSSIACTNANTTTNGGQYTGTASVNVGNGWSNSSNNFTAPVAGTYLVNYSGWTNYTPGYGYMGIYKNGANYYTWHYNHGNYQMHTISSGTLYLALAQNDVITFIRAGAGNGVFSGMWFNISLFG